MILEQEWVHLKETHLPKTVLLISWHVSTQEFVNHIRKHVLCHHNNTTKKSIFKKCLKGGHVTTRNLWHSYWICKVIVDMQLCIFWTSISRSSTNILYTHYIFSCKFIAIFLHLHIHGCNFTSRFIHSLTCPCNFNMLHYAFSCTCM